MFCMYCTWLGVCACVYVWVQSPRLCLHTCIAYCLAITLYMAHWPLPPLYLQPGLPRGWVSSCSLAPQSCWLPPGKSLNHILSLITLEPWPPLCLDHRKEVYLSVKALLSSLSATASLSKISMQNENHHMLINNNIHQTILFLLMYTVENDWADNSVKLLKDTMKTLNKKFPSCVY